MTQTLDRLGSPAPEPDHTDDDTRRRQALRAVAAGCISRSGLEETLVVLGAGLADLAPVIEAGILTDDGSGLAFRSVAYRLSAYLAGSESERQAVHAAIDSSHGPAPTAGRNQEHRAWNRTLARLPAASAAAALVERATEQRWDGNDLARAAETLESAARLVAHPATRDDHLCRAAELWAAAGHPGRAAVVAREVSSTGAAPARVRAGRTLAWTTLLGGDEATGTRMVAAEVDRSLADGDDGAAAALLSQLSGFALRGGRFGEALTHAERAVALAAGGDGRMWQARLALGAALIASGRTDEGGTVLPAPGEMLSRADLVADGLLLAQVGGSARIWAEDYEQARRFIDDLEHRCRSAGVVAPLPAALTSRALLEYRLCRWPEAARAAAEALHLSHRYGQPVLTPLAATVLATIEAAQGRAAECRERCLALLDPAAPGGPTVRTAALSALGLLELGEGRFEDAAHWYQILAGGAAAGRGLHPSLNMWEADLADAYLGAGLRDRAEAVLAGLEARARTSLSVRSQNAVKRVRAALATDPAEAERLFAEVLHAYRGPGLRFARARAHLARGTFLAGSGQEDAARAALGLALDEFNSLGARGWAARAAAALHALGPRPGGDPATAVADMSPLELRVAMAAAMGAGLEEIAAGLFIDAAQAAAALASAVAKAGVDGPAGLVPLIGRLASAGAHRIGPADRAGPDAGAGSGPGPVSPVRIRMLGGFGVADGRGSADLTDGVSARAVKVVALAGKIPSEELIEELWPDTAPDLGRARLRSLLARLRRQFRPVLVRQGSWVVLADGVTVDVDEFECRAQEAQAAVATGSATAGELARAAMALYPGELLPTDRYLDFTAAARERLRRRYLAVTGVAVDDACARGEPETAVRLIEDAISVDPYDEHLYLRAATILAGAGRGSEALGMLRWGEKALAELGFTLSPAAEELRSRL